MQSFDLALNLSIDLSVRILHAGQALTRIIDRCMFRFRDCKYSLCSSRSLKQALDAKLGALSTNNVFHFGFCNLTK